MTYIQFNIGIITKIEDFDDDIEFMNEVGEFLAKDIEKIYDNCEDHLETEYLGAKIL